MAVNQYPDAGFPSKHMSYPKCPARLARVALECGLLALGADRVAEVITFGLCGFVLVSSGRTSRFTGPGDCPGRSVNAMLRGLMCHLWPGRPLGSRRLRNVRSETRIRPDETLVRRKRAACSIDRGVLQCVVASERFVVLGATPSVDR
jgi:hypothetical protein